MNDATEVPYSGPSLVLRVALVFVPYIGISAVHIWALAIGHESAYPTKLALMPILAMSVVLGMIGAVRFPRGPVLLLLVAIVLSWLGDGSTFFFPIFDELPVMLVCFGLALLAYIWVFWRSPGIARRSVPWWAYVYAVWWLVLVLILGADTGALFVPVAGYGIVLAAAAFFAARCGPVIAWGGVSLLVSHTILAFKLFMPDTAAVWMGPAIMTAYTVGQGLIAYGVVRALRSDESPQVPTSATS